MKLAELFEVSKPALAAYINKAVPDYKQKEIRAQWLDDEDIWSEETYRANQDEVKHLQNKAAARKKSVGKAWTKIRK